MAKKLTVLTAIMLLCAVFVSCGTPTPDAPLTSEQVAELRKDYPTIEFNGSLRIPDDVFDDESNLKTADVILLVEVASPLELETTKMAVDAERTFFDNVKFHYYRVKVNEVIAVNHNEFTRGHKSKKENLDLKFPYEEIYLWYPDWDEPEFKVGSKLVISGIYSQERDSLPLISTSSYAGYYLTDDKYVISMTTNPYLDKYSGETYKDFRNRCINFTEKHEW
jgi:hypothetical protein